ncbi:MAG: hypothetical protein Q4C50_01395 [Eubacteriales bacterium]|nr:hypothetical protein [Eubacteriales bacterium]
MVEVREFGKLEDGRTVHCFRITNQHGEFAEFLDYGAAIHNICTADSKGHCGDIVLHAREAKELKRAREGFTIGRCANRIAYGRYTADGREYQLETGPDGHYLHGGSGNYARQMFDASACEDENAVYMHFSDPGMGGFDCPVEVNLRFSFDDAHRLTVTYRMCPEGTTLLCPTNHSFFNLDGGDIRNYQFRIPISRYAPRGELGMPSGKSLPVEETFFDYQNGKKLGDVLKDYVHTLPTGQERLSYDDFYVRNTMDFGLMAEVYAPASGRLMRLYSDMQSLVFCTPGPRFSGDPDYPCFCMEPQYVPNAVNCNGYYAVPLFHAGETLESTTVYEFLTGRNARNI